MIEIPLTFEVLFENDTVHKQAWTIGQLVHRTKNLATKNKANNCSVRAYRIERKQARWLFRVSCRESYSAPYHTCRFRVDVDPDRFTKFTSKSTVYVSCSCPAWLYWGSAYWATIKDFADGRKVLIPPRIRDSQGLNYLCKHVIAATPYFKGYSVPVPAELLEEENVVEEKPLVVENE